MANLPSERATARTIPLFNNYVRKPEIVLTAPHVNPNNNTTVAPPVPTTGWIYPRKN